MVVLPPSNLAYIHSIPLVDTFGNLSEFQDHFNRAESCDPPFPFLVLSSSLNFIARWIMKFLEGWIYNLLKITHYTQSVIFPNFKTTLIALNLVFPISRTVLSFFLPRPYCLLVLENDNLWTMVQNIQGNSSYCVTNYYLHL